MRLIDGERIYSASDLTNFLACPHLSSLALGRLEGRIREPPPRAASTGDLAAAKGIEHERLYLEQMRDLHGEAMVSVEAGAAECQLREAVAATTAAMREGAPVIYQAAFLEKGWMGYADFLERVDTPSELGDWSYRPLDTKLARSAKPYFAIQLSLYGELIAALQGTLPERLELILGDGERRSLLAADFRAYFERMKARFLASIEAGLEGTYPEPVAHCEVCDWAAPCEERRVADDHLSQVAGLGRAQGEKLAEAGLATVAELAEAGGEQRPAGMASATFEKLRTQAELQVSESESGEGRVLLLEPEPVGEASPRGFALLPAPSPGDLFFDIEGDPFYDEGLEYLWGVTYTEEGERRFRAFWGLDHATEKRAFEEFIDFVSERRRRFPDLHVYHYAPYERTALGRLMGRYATREEEVDSLFRERVLVDLYRVVEQSMRISRPSYSLKQVEDFYDQGREAEVKQAGDSVLMFERWREDADAAMLSAIESYNKEDCDSTLALREWLLGQRDLCESLYGVEIPPRAPGEPDPGAEASLQTSAETAALQEQLLAGVPEDSGGHASRRLLAQVLDYHRREAKPGWWKYFDRLEASDEELTESDSEALGGLRREGPPRPLPPPARSSLQRFSFPAQEHKIGPGDFKDPHSCGIDPVSGESDLKPKGVEVVEVDERGGALTLKLSAARLAEEQSALIPGGPYSTPLQRAALADLAGAVIEDGLDRIPRYTAARDILRSAPPRTAAVPSGEPLQGEHSDRARVKAIAAGLEDSYLFIQGPPGSGKTYTGAEVILDLIGAGHTVGVAANSHKAINKLLAEVEGQARSADLLLRGRKKFSEPDQCYEPPAPAAGEPLITNSKKNEDFAPGHDLDLLAGTAWLWCREEMRESVDYLVIDEAGQISLADALAMATAARNVILLGDPLQLAQVSQGTHPAGSGASVLEHLLGSQTTVPRTRGIFLEQTRRMHPDVCRFVSAAIYEGRLGWESSCERQRVDAEGPLTGTGVRSIPVDHRGNSRRSPEEAQVIADAIESLGGAIFTDSEGTTSELEADQIMVVTPYNAQVRCLRAALDERGLGEVAVGTVDKFQGQEAAVVFFSMATSSGAEIPRNVEFLYSRNRLNVAVSRARCLAILVASPELMSIECRSLEQMRLVNALCLLDEMGRRAEVEIESGG